VPAGAKIPDDCKVLVVANPRPPVDPRVAQEPVGRGAAVRAGRSHVLGMVPGQGALARLGLDDRDAEAVAEHFWQLHNQPKGSWTPEVKYAP